MVCPSEIRDVALRFWGSATVPRHQGGGIPVILSSLWIGCGQASSTVNQTSEAEKFSITVASICQCPSPKVSVLFSGDLLRASVPLRGLRPSHQRTVPQTCQFHSLQIFLTNFLRVLSPKMVGKSEQLMQNITARRSVFTFMFHITLIL